MNFENKSILITGASSGIGKALAELLAQKHCSLFLLARRSEIIETNFEKLIDTKAKIYIYNCDVSDKQSVLETFNAIKKKTEFIDIAILNSGITEKVNIEKYSSDTAQRVIGTNFFGIVYWVEQLLPDFLKNGSGIIAGITSLADNRGYSGAGFYSASKASASIYLEGLRVELEPRGIKVITVKPGFVKSELTDKNNFRMPFIMRAEKAAKIILRGIEKEKRVIQFPKRLVVLVKLIGLLPRNIYELSARKRK